MSKLWGGRFEEEADQRFARYNESFSFDHRLLIVDIQGSLAYARALERAGVLSLEESIQMQDGLQVLLERARTSADWIEKGQQEGIEDVHSFVEQALVLEIGDLAYKLHTGRSRNDQVATDLRLFLRAEIEQTQEYFRTLLRTLIQLAEQHINVVLPGYTHLQRAQPILFAHFLMAYAEMFLRDMERFQDTSRRTNRLSLGSGALAGNSHGIDRRQLAKDLGFADISYNSIDAVSDRDFVLDYLSAASIAMMHLSRLSEDLILYTSKEFGFIEMSDKVATGSSLMPQKKNPDALELIRGKIGRVVGHHMGLLTVCKGLPLCYNKDLQEDKEALFDTIETLHDSLAVMDIVLSSLKVNALNMRKAANHGYLNATELADYLVRRGLPFRQAHEVVGQLVMSGLQQGKELHEMDLGEFRKHSPLFAEDLFPHLNLQPAIDSKSVEGGTATQRVLETIERVKLHT